MAKINLKRAVLNVAGHDPVHGGASLIAWLLGQGAQVTVTGAAQTEATGQLMRRVDAQLKRSAPDGKAYNDMRARLHWTARTSADTVDALSLFSQVWPGRVIGVAGSLGKTTAATWAGHLIRTASVVGAVPERGYFSALTDRAKTAVVEIHGEQRLAGTRFVTVNTDEAEAYRADPCMARIDTAAFAAVWGGHNLGNLAVAVRAARAAGVSEDDIVRRAAALPQVPYRGEVIFRDTKLIVVNDAAAHTPVAGAAAVVRWGGPTTVLITGGNGPEGDYRPWAETVAAHIRPTNILLHAGDAAPAMRRALRPHGFTVRAFETLAGTWQASLSRAATYVSSTILYSPAVRGAEPFNDIFERGQEFNAVAAEPRP